MKPILGLLLCTTLFAAHIIAENPSPAIVSREFIFDESTKPAPSCHASTIAQTKDGNLAAAWFGGTAEGNKDVVIWFARHIDGKWSKAVEVGDGVQTDGSRHPCWNPVLLQSKDGSLLLFYKVGPSPQKWWGMLRTSDDNGATWSAPKKLPDGILGPIKNKPVQLPDGAILCPASTESVAKPSAWRVHFELTRDKGNTFRSAAPSSPGEPPIDAIQPSILFLGGKELLALGRSRQGQIFQVKSSDLGETWGAMSLASLPNPNSGTDAVTMKNGLHVLIYNHTKKGRSPLNVAVSKDGAAWKAALVLESEPGEYSYPAVIQTADDKLHFTYTWKRKLVRHVVVDPAKFELKDIVNGEWPK